MREELMVKGDTTNKTSSGELSLTGRIKGQRERPRVAEAGARHGGWWQRSWGFVARKITENHSNG